MRSTTARVKDVFKPDDEDAVTVLRLAAASNDLWTLLRIVPPRDMDAVEDHATRRYALRMAALHLNEIRGLVNDLAFDHALRKCARGPELENHAAELKRRLNSGQLAAILTLARNGFAGHYDRTQFEESLGLIGEDELVTWSEASQHVALVDRVWDVALCRVSHEKYRCLDVENSVERAINHLFDVQKELFFVVNRLIVGLFAAAFPGRYGVGRG